MKAFACPALYYLMSITCFLSASAAEQKSSPPPVWLCTNDWVHAGKLPGNFRSAFSKQQALPALKESGSAEFSQTGLELIKQQTDGKQLVVVDLRQESHGLIDGKPVSWYYKDNEINSGKSLKQIQADEQARLNQLASQGAATVYQMQKAGEGPKTGGNPQNIKVSKACTEAQLCQAAGVKYVRIPVADFHAPADAQVDQFVQMVKSLSGNEWLHFHCAAGKGRTTTFMTMYDMMKNAGVASLDQILARQRSIGGIDLLAEKKSGDSFRESAHAARSQFIQQFYAYCQSQIPQGFAEPWSKWHKTK